MRRVALITAVAALTLTATASAATPVYWAPAQVSKLVLSPATKVSGVIAAGNYTLSRLPMGFTPNILTAKCQGLGKRYKTGFAVFSCATRWKVPSDGSGTINKATLWVRPWSSTWICETTINAAACPPPLPAHPLANDPRACGRDPAYCISTAAKNAMQSKLGTVANLGCVAVTVFVYHCEWSGPTGTVMFKQGKTAWTTVVTQP